MPLARTQRRRRRRSLPKLRVSAVMLAAFVFGPLLVWFQQDYTISLQSPVRLTLEWPLVT